MMIAIHGRRKPWLCRRSSSKYLLQKVMRMCLREYVS